MSDIKIDWFSFTYIPDDVRIAESFSILDAFLKDFPSFNKVFSECVVVGSGKGRYYTNCVAWNDNILISFDDDTCDRKKLDGSSLSEFEHGVNVSIPSHALGNVNEMLGLDSVSFDFAKIWGILKEKCCKVSRLDICFDDFSKTFYPEDFEFFWNNNMLQSPCRKMTCCHTSCTSERTPLGFANISKGCTFYVGARKNKILRIYDKNAESDGLNDSIRYEMEFHNIYANFVADSILDGSFSFIDTLEHYFIKVKCGNFDKTQLYRDDELEEWVNFKKVQFSEKIDNVEFPRVVKDVSMEKKRNWLERQVVKSLYQFILCDGCDALFDLIDDVSLSDKDFKIVTDALRIYNQSDQLDRNRSDWLKLKQLFLQRDIL